MGTSRSNNDGLFTFSRANVSCCDSNYSKRDNELVKKTAKKKNITFLRAGGPEVVVNTMAKAVDLVEVVRQCKGRVCVVKVGNDFVDSWWDFEEQGIVDKFGEAVERQLVKVITRGKLEKKTKEHTVFFMSLLRALRLVSSA